MVRYSTELRNYLHAARQYCQMAPALQSVVYERVGPTVSVFAPPARGTRLQRVPVFGGELRCQTFMQLGAAQRHRRQPGLVEGLVNEDQPEPPTVRDRAVAAGIPTERLLHYLEAGQLLLDGDTGEPVNAQSIRHETSTGVAS